MARGQNGQYGLALAEVLRSRAFTRPSGPGHGTTEAVPAALNERHGDLETATWQPDEYERMLANTMQAEDGARAQAVWERLRAAGPKVPHERLAVVAARCAAVLDSLSRAASEDGRALLLALDDVLDLAVAPGGPPAGATDSAAAG